MKENKERQLQEEKAEVRRKQREEMLLSKKRPKSGTRLFVFVRVRLHVCTNVMCMYVCMYAHVCICVCVCARACVCACVLSLICISKPNHTYIK